MSFGEKIHPTNCLHSGIYAYIYYILLLLLLYGFMGFGEKVEGPALKIRADLQYSNSTGHWRSDYLKKSIGGWEGTNSSGRSGKESKTSVTEGGLWRGWVKWRKGNHYEMNFCATFVNTLSWTNIQIISYAIFKRNDSLEHSNILVWKKRCYQMSDYICLKSY